tara:strand:- start:34 stop:444 length:411 start_codon:yes stop_codon:yes gene_type:complete
MTGSMEKIREELKKEIQKSVDVIYDKACKAADPDRFVTDLLIGIVNKVGPETIEEVMELLTEDDWNRTQLVIEPLRGMEKEALLETHSLSPLDVASYVIKRNLFNEGRDELRKAHKIGFDAPDSRFTKVYFNRTHF